MGTSLLEDIHYFRIPVTDLSEAVTWYTDCLGFNLLHSNKELAVIKLQSGTLLTLVAADKESRGHFTINGQPEFSVALTTSNIQALHDHLNKQNVQTDEIKEDSGHKYFHFYDPSGNKLQVHN